MSQVNRSLGTDFVQTECQLHYDPKYLKGMVGQTAARRAAGVVVEMVKEGWLGSMFFSSWYIVPSAQ